MEGRRARVSPLSAQLDDHFRRLARAQLIGFEQLGPNVVRAWEHYSVFAEFNVIGVDGFKLEPHRLETKDQLEVHGARAVIQPVRDLPWLGVRCIGRCPESEAARFLELGQGPIAAPPTSEFVLGKDEFELLRELCAVITNHEQVLVKDPFA